MGLYKTGVFKAQTGAFNVCPVRKKKMTIFRNMV